MRTTSNDIIQEPVWFILYSSYHKENEVKKLLECNGIRCFIPVTNEYVTSDGKTFHKVLPACPGTIFARSSFKIIRQVITNKEFTGFKTNCKNGIFTPLTVSDNVMQQFIMAAGSPDVKISDYLAKDMSEVERVRVTEGKFTGTEGLLAYVKGLRGKCFIIVAGSMAAIIPGIRKEHVETLK